MNSSSKRTARRILLRILLWLGNPRRSWALALWCCTLLLVCASCGTDQVAGPELPPFDAAKELIAEVTLWHGGRLAAVTVAFDDANACYHEIAAPALEQRGLRGTFNLDTRRASQNWPAWAALHERGHELANHTRSHHRLAELSLKDARSEIEGGRADLLANIPGLLDVPTFAYPNGSSNEEVRAIVMETHLSARGCSGVNPPSPSDYSCLGGHTRGTLADWKSHVDECFATRAWCIQYFHEIGGTGVAKEDFEAYLDYLVAKSDSVWIAPQGEVAKYALERDQTIVRIKGKNPAHVYLEAASNSTRLDVPLTVSLKVASTEIGELLIDGVRYQVGTQMPVLIDMKPNTDVSLKAVVSRPS